MSDAREAAEPLSEQQIEAGCKASFERMLWQRDDWRQRLSHAPLKAIHDYAFHAGGEFASEHGAKELDKQTARASELTVYSSTHGKEIPVTQAIEEMTEKWVEDGNSCEQTTLDLLKCVSVLLSALGIGK